MAKPENCGVADVGGYVRGHAVGDLVLKESTRLMRSFARVEDVLCRIGGEEFLIV